MYTRKDVEERNNSKEETSASIIYALGGKNNISDLDCCATRLRITVSNSSLVNEQSLKETGAKGVIIKGNGVQVIYGPHVSNIKSRLEDYLDLGLDPA